MGKIIVAGSINMDVVTQTKHHPRPGETIFGHSLQYIPGGKGSNQAVAASRLHENVYLAGKLGRDAFGQALTEFLQAENLNLEYLTYSGAKPSGVAIINVDEASENTIIVVSGSNFEVSEADVYAIPVAPDDVVVSVFEIPQAAIKHLFERARAAGARTVLNPAPAGNFTDGLLALVDYLIVNETELAFFSGKADTSEDFDSIASSVQSMRHDADQTVIVTLGAKGVVCVTGEGVTHVQGQPVKAVDTTGAGDCFTGAFAVALSEGKPLKDALHFANTAASLSVQKVGASSSMPHRADVDAAL